VAVVTTRTAETAEIVKGTAETVANWEVGWIMGMDGEGTMCMTMVELEWK
jgi:hypothetical protein